LIVPDPSKCQSAALSGFTPDKVALTVTTTRGSREFNLASPYQNRNANGQRAGRSRTDVSGASPGRDATFAAACAGLRAAVRVTVSAIELSGTKTRMVYLRRV
jgi:hypothetical protein